MTRSVHACNTGKYGVIQAGLALCNNKRAREFTSAITPERPVTCQRCLVLAARRP